MHSIEAASDLDELIGLADAAVVGPGLGRSDWARACLGRVLDSGLALVADADALNLVAAAPVARGNWVITPHPGEAARLLASSVEDVERDRLASVRTLAARYGAWRSSKVRTRSSRPAPARPPSAIAATPAWRAAAWATCFRA